MYGSKIKKLRKDQRMSIRQLAQLAQLSKTTINEIENDIITNPTIETLQKIADALNVPIGLILEKEDTIQQIAEDLNEFADFRGSLSHLPADQRKELLQDIIKHEPEIVYSVFSNADGFIGPVTHDEAIALNAYLKLYREAKTKIE